MARQTKTRSQVKLGAVSSGKRQRGGSTRSRSQGTISEFSPVRSAKKFASGLNYRKVWQQVQARPGLMYLAGGVGAFFLIRSAFRYYKGHPEILEFIKENIDTVEEKIGEFRESFNSDSEVAEARH